MKILSTLMLTCGLVFGAFCSENAAPDIKERTEKFADCLLRMIPKDFRANWVALEDIKDNPEILNTAVIERIKKKYNVYYVYNDRKDIPSKYKIAYSKDMVVYRGGFYLSYSLIGDLGKDFVLLSYRFEGYGMDMDKDNSYIGGVGGIGYTWNGKEWVDKM